MLWIFLWLSVGVLWAEDGSRLWLRYDRLDSSLAGEYKTNVTQLVIPSSFAVVGEEFGAGVSGLLGKEVPMVSSVTRDGAVVVGTPASLPLVGRLVDASSLKACGAEGYVIRSVQFNDFSITVIAANTRVGALYGSFHFLRLMQTGQSLAGLSIQEAPRLQRRLLNHWDNLDGSVERGYAGASIWQWADLPETVNPRIKDYARANASIGINGVAVNNVNSQAEILTAEYIAKAAAIADVLRPYGIRLYFSVKFTSPRVIGGLATADPLDGKVVAWWKAKADAIYAAIPDFGGFLVKAYSEGQPGPQQYGRSHADGANVLAAALAPHGGVVMWRSFVYDMTIDSDRTKCAYLEFVPLDGKFASNVFVQTKNGPIDFQPREPFSPLFGAMKQTPLMMELQITQEYTGQAKHLVYLGPQWKEVLDADTYANGAGTTVAKIIDGSAEGHSMSGIAGVSGIGSDRNWCGHHFSQANWYAYGRLAWDADLSAAAIAEEWVRMTWSNEPKVVKAIAGMMDGSWQACVDYMTPLGLHHLMAEGHHYGPGPDVVHPEREDWSSTYYHKAGPDGIGFDRSSTGTNAVSQYFSPLKEQWNCLETCPEKYLLWFHHVAWDYRMASGKTLWEELQVRYNRGVDEVEKMQVVWASLEGEVDPSRFEHVSERLTMQLENAQAWRDVCLGYFSTCKNNQSQR